MVRIQVDVTVDGIDGAIRHVVELGGTDTKERHVHPEGTVGVLKDLEDNEFCVAQNRIPGV